MKHRAIKFALAVMFVSSLAFAENPTDAPLMPNDDYAALLHQQNHQDVKTNSKSKPSRKKDESVSVKAKTENPAKDDRDKHQSNSGDRTASGDFAGSN